MNGGAARAPHDGGSAAYLRQFLSPQKYPDQVLTPEVLPREPAKHDATGAPSRYGPNNDHPHHKAFANPYIRQLTADRDATSLERDLEHLKVNHNPAGGLVSHFAR